MSSLWKHVRPKRLGQFSLAYGRSALETFQRRASAPVDVTVVTPAVEKDFAFLPIALASLVNLRDVRVVECVVVTPTPESLSGLNPGFPVRVISDEEALAGVTSPPSVVVAGRDRTGWILQQLVKLSCFNFATTPYVLWHDADTAFVRPTSSRRLDKTILYVAKEYHSPYQNFIDRVYPGLRKQHVSFVGHSMLVQREALLQLLSEISERTSWEVALVDALDRNENSAMSEFDLYARYALARWSTSHTTGGRRHLDVKAPPVSLRDAEMTYRARTTSISYHRR